MPCRDGCFATKGKIDQDIHFINVSLNVANLQYNETKVKHTQVRHGRGGNATYKEIKSYILEKYGLNVSSLYIGQIKDKVGIKERVNYNIGSKGGRVPQCPIDKEKAICNAFEFFGMI